MLKRLILVLVGSFVLELPGGSAIGAPEAATTRGERTAPCTENRNLTTMDEVFIKSARELHGKTWTVAIPDASALHSMLNSYPEALRSRAKKTVAGTIPIKVMWVDSLLRRYKKDRLTRPDPTMERALSQRADLCEFAGESTVKAWETLLPFPLEHKPDVGNFDIPPSQKGKIR